MGNIRLEDLYRDILETVRGNFTAGAQSQQETFLDEISKYLAQDAEITDPLYGFWETKASGKNVEISGCAWDDDRKLLTLIGCEFFNDDEIQTVTKELYERKFKALRNFVTLATDPKNPLYANMAATDPASEVARIVFDNFRTARNVEFILITNGQKTRALTKADAKITLADMDAEKYAFKVFDINRIYQLRTSDASFEDMEIDFVEKGNDDLGIKCLSAVNEDGTDYKSYLAVMPAETLAKIYEEFGQKLLEQNVRTFLQFRPKVNKGMSITIDEAPERFFAYNNGLTCTAAEPDFDTVGDTLYLKSARGFQIVNGGQTTNVIYSAHKNKKDLSRVSVQMKLSVIADREKYSDFVEKVARYANTQNPVKESDFFSNSAFHKKFKDISQRLWAPAVDGRQNKTRWYYERTRGQYLSEYSGKSKKEENDFLHIYPKDQMIDKIVLAKTEAIFGGAPYMSNRQQQAFAYFAETIEKKIEKNEESINDNYFKELIAKVILAKKTDSIVVATDWYQANRSVKSEFKAFALALLNSYVLNKQRFLDFESVWNLQSMPEPFEKAVKIAIDAVKAFMIAKNPDPADWREKFKIKGLWEETSKLDLNLPEDLLEDISVDAEKEKTEKRYAVKEAKMDTGIDAQIFVVNQPKTVWTTLLEFYTKNRILTGTTEYGVLSSMAMGKIRLPSDRQSVVLKELYCLAQQHDVKL